MTSSAKARRALALVLAATGVTCAAGGDARAQGTAQSAAQSTAQSTAQAQADALFGEGRELLEKGRYAEACPKLAKSQELASAVGTLLNLAYCWEQTGKLRSALDAYAQVEAIAGGAGETKRAAFARDRYAAIEPRMMKLVVRIAPPAAPGVEVKRNGVAMAKTELDRPIGVNPEDYIVTATAPGYAPWKGAIVVKGEGGVVTVIVPPLAQLAAAPVAPRGITIGDYRLGALGLGAFSALAIGAGVGLAFSAKSRYGDAGAHCTDAGCDETGRAIQHGAVAQGNVATVFLGLGLLSGGAAVYLWIAGAPASESGGGAPPVAKKASVRVEAHPLAVGLKGVF